MKKCYDINKIFIYEGQKESYWLVGFDQEGKQCDLDGSHSTPLGVTQALELRKRINILRKNTEGVTYKMVMVEFSDVPDLDSEVNQTAIDILNHNLS